MIKTLKSNTKKSQDNVSEKKPYKDPLIREQVYYVNGMHCASCEVLIENKLLKERGVKSIEASANKGKVIVEYSGRAPSVESLNKAFSAENYRFSDKPLESKRTPKLMNYSKDGQLIIDRQKLKNLFIVVGFSFVFMIGFLFLHRSGFSAMVNVNGGSAMPMFILFGLLAGFSSCAALVGGVILSMSKQWSELYADNDSNFKRLEPHFLFNAGRLLSYAVLGAILGAIGSFFRLSVAFTSALVIGVSIIMLFLGLQMLGVKYFRKFQISMPKFVTRYVADETNFKGKYMPLIMGALTFFLPCGFTITAQGLALTSGSALQGGLIMLFFAIGTVPALFAIGMSSVAFTKSPHMANRFLKIAGIVVLFFAFFNINSQLNVLGYSSFDDISFSAGKEAAASDDGLPVIVNGKQILKSDALAYGYEPKNLRVRAGVPVRWEITDKGTSGCTNAIISKDLFRGQVSLTPGTVSVKEFTPEKPGRYKYSCWMGMVTGTIDVIDPNDKNAPLSNIITPKTVPSGSSGCGGGGSCGGSCGQTTCGCGK